MLFQIFSLQEGKGEQQSLYHWDILCLLPTHIFSNVNECAKLLLGFHKKDDQKMTCCLVGWMNEYSLGYYYTTTQEKE